MTSINYETTSEGVILTSNEGEYLGTIYYHPNQYYDKGGNDSNYKKWTVCMSVVGLKEPVHFNNLEAAKYFALAQYLEVRG